MKIRTKTDIRKSTLGTVLVALLAGLPQMATEAGAAERAPLPAPTPRSAQQATSIARDSRALTPRPAQQSTSMIRASVAPDGIQEPPPDVAVEVNGLSCPFCAYGIEKKFVERPEVDSVVVELEQNEVHLWLRSGHELADEAVRSTVEEAGFTPGAVRRPERSGAGWK